MVLCYVEEITSLLIKWLQNLESLAAYLTGSSPSPAHLSQPNPGTNSATSAVVKDVAATSQQCLGESRKKATFEEVSKAFHGQTYQNLSDVVKRATSELATLCAEMEIYSFHSNTSGVAGKDKDQEVTTMDTVEREKGSGLSSEKERELDVDSGIMASESDRGKDNHGRTAAEKEKEAIDDGGSRATERSEREKESDLTSSQKEGVADGTSTTMHKENEREKAVSLLSSSVEQCGSLVEFVRCYGPLLDGMRLKQLLLSSREWWERRECLAALSAANEYETCTAGESQILHVTNVSYDKLIMFGQTVNNAHKCSFHLLNFWTGHSI